MIVYDTKIKCKRVTGKKNRLVYNTKSNELIWIINGTDKSKTWTKHEVEECDSEQIAWDRVSDLGLSVNNDIGEEPKWETTTKKH